MRHSQRFPRTNALTRGVLICGVAENEGEKWMRGESGKDGRHPLFILRLRIASTPTGSLRQVHRDVQNGRERVPYLNKVLGELVCCSSSSFVSASLISWTSSPLTSPIISVSLLILCAVPITPFSLAQSQIASHPSQLRNAITQRRRKRETQEECVDGSAADALDRWMD